MEAIYSTKTNEDGMAAFVYVNTGRHGGFNVVLKDMDAAMTVPLVMIYPTLEMATAEADKLV